MAARETSATTARITIMVIHVFWCNVPAQSVKGLVLIMLWVTNQSNQTNVLIKATAKPANKRYGRYTCKSNNCDQLTMSGSHYLSTKIANCNTNFQKVSVKTQLYSGP